MTTSPPGFRAIYDGLDFKCFAREDGVRLVIAVETIASDDGNQWSALWKVFRYPLADGEAPMASGITDNSAAINEAYAAAMAQATRWLTDPIA
jgi:hypothetical protein